MVTDPNIINMEDRTTNMTDDNVKDNQNQMDTEALTVISKDSTAHRNNTLGQLDAQAHQVAPHNIIPQLGEELTHRVTITQHGDSLDLDIGNLILVLVMMILTMTKSQLW